MDGYTKGIVYSVQENTWMDETGTLDWIKHVNPMLYSNVEFTYSLWMNLKSTWWGVSLTEFRQPLQVQSHLEMPRILVQLGHTQRTWKLAPQTDPKWSPTWSLTRFQPICPLSARDGRYACQVSRAHRTHSRL